MERIDPGKLIAAVYKRKIIWDKKDNLHYKRQLIDKAWDEIHQEFEGIEGHMLRKRWKYLRDQFAAEWSKVPPGKVYDDHKARKWRYFNQLAFLKDVTQPRQFRKLYTEGDTSTSSHDVPEGEGNDNNNSSQQDTKDVHHSIPLEMEVQAVDIYPTHVHNGHQQSLPLAPDPPKRGSWDRAHNTPYEYDQNSNFLQIRERELAHIINTERDRSNRERQDEDDEHLLYFRSMLPHIKRIPQNRILKFRRDLGNLVQEFAYPEYVNEHHKDPAPPSGDDTCPTTH